MDFEGLALRWYDRVEEFEIRESVVRTLQGEEQQRAVLAQTNAWINHLEPLFRDCERVAGVEREFHGVMSASMVVFVVFLVSVLVAADEFHHAFATGFAAGMLVVAVCALAWHSWCWMAVRVAIGELRAKRNKIAIVGQGQNDEESQLI